MLKRVQMRGGARRPHARRSRVRGVRGHVWAPRTKVRPSDNLARYVARRPRAPYLRRWAFFSILLDALEERAVLDEDAAALLGAPHAVDVVVVLRETLAVLLVRREAREVDQGQRDVRRTGELRRQPVADE